MENKFFNIKDLKKEQAEAPLETGLEAFVNITLNQLKGIIIPKVNPAPVEPGLFPYNGVNFYLN